MLKIPQKTCSRKRILDNAVIIQRFLSHYHYAVADGAVDYPMFKLEGGASLRSASLVAPIFYAFAVSFPPAFSRMIMKITPRTMRAI